MAHIQKKTYTSRRNGKTATVWQARYVAPDGKMRTKRFELKVDAEAWLNTNGADIARGQWIDPNAGKVTFREYAGTWIEGRLTPAGEPLRPTTRAKYDYLLEHHLYDAFGDLHLSKITPESVRLWRARLAVDHPATAAGAYRLLSAILRTAVQDEKIAKSPCKVKGGGGEQAPERPVATVAEVAAAAAACPSPYGLAVLLAAWCQLRRGEVLGLQRQDVDLDAGTIRIARAFCVTSKGATLVGDPKTEAGKRTLVAPANVIAELSSRLDEIGPEPEAWLFPGEGANPTTPRTLDRAWDKAREAVGRTDLRYHDLRHTGLTFAAATGASTAELMRRAGHRSPTAALRYQHATVDRDRVLADALGELASATNVVPLRGTKEGRSSKRRAKAAGE